MKAAFITELGPPAAIRFGDLEAPELSPDAVRVRVLAVAVDPVDTYIRAGTYRTPETFPFVLGRDMVGTVLEVGADVQGFSVGDRVWCNNQGYDGRQGTFAEIICVEAPYLYKLPAEADAHDALAVFHSALTAYVGLHEKAHIKAGEVLFINGGSGNVGKAMIQMATGIGVRVFTTAGHAETAAECSAAGAEAVIDYKREDVVARLSALAPDGVDVVWDATLHADLDLAVNALRHNGRIVLMAGGDARPVFPVGPFYRKNATVLGFEISNANLDILTRAAAEINRLLAAGRLHGKVAQVLPLSAAAEAHRLMEASLAGQHVLDGKLILVPDRT